MFTLLLRFSKLDAFVKGLEEEIRKIDAFKHELPLCMLPLNDAIVVLKKESMLCMDAKPVSEEFIPLNNNKTENDYNEDGALITAEEVKDF